MSTDMTTPEPVVEVRTSNDEAIRYRVTKLFDDLPCCHRSFAHQGKCAFLHGYERSFVIEFGCHTLEEGTGFVVDFGALKEVRSMLEHQFDHTTVIAADDPELSLFRDLHERKILDLRVMRHPGMEGAARWVFEEVSALVARRTSGRVQVTKVEARESRKNAVAYTNGRGVAR